MEQQLTKQWCKIFNSTATATILYKLLCIKAPNKLAELTTLFTLFTIKNTCKRLSKKIKYYKGALRCKDVNS